MNKAVFLDRDGVLNQTIIRDGKPYAPRTLDEFKINPDIQELFRLKNLGYNLIVVTNQPDVANGIVTRDFVDDLHLRLRKAFPPDEIFACFHSEEQNCDCRKPKAGMFYHARDALNVDLTKSYMIGDRWRDVVAGQTAGCSTVFIDHKYQDNGPAFKPDFTCNTLLEAIQWIENR